MDNGGCDEVCVNLQGGSTCSCGTGKVLNIDKKSCKVVGE